MAVRLSVFNGALTLIGHKTMKGEHEDSPQGEACRIFYPNEYESLLNLIPWPEAYSRTFLEPAYDTITTTLLGTHGVPSQAPRRSPA